MKRIILIFFISILLLSGCTSKDIKVSTNNIKNEEIIKLKKKY